MNDYENWLHNLLITVALIAFGYWLAQLSPCPDKAARQPIPNIIKDEKPKTQRELNIENSK